MVALWRDDPDLKGKFHPQYPDDLQVIVHEGSFRFTQSRPEVMWARGGARLEWTHGNGKQGYAYKAILLNQPHQLKTVKQGDEILLLAHQNYQHAIRVMHDYAFQRDFCEITPCNRCGLPELFDTPADLMKLTFPDLPPDAAMQMFTSFCPVCGQQGTLGVKVNDVKAVRRK